MAEPAARIPKTAPGPCPLSFAQQRLWFLDQWEAGSPAYNVPEVLRVAGALDAAALERALNEIVRRHDALRTRFEAVKGSPRQVVEPYAAFALAIEDLSRLPEADREAQARALVAQEAATPFDLSRGPMYRFRAARLAADDHVLLLSFHHIAFDGWSYGVFTQELNQLYEAYRNGQESPLPELEVQYADFAVWQRQQMQGEALEAQLSYWRKHLAGVTPLELPTDRPRPAAQSYRGAYHSFLLPRATLDRVRAFAKARGVTLFMPLLAAFQTLLHRYTGQADVPVGAPIAGRTRAETEKLIGFFVNTLVLRTDLSGDPTFSQLLDRVREVCVGAYAHQDVPFEKLVEDLHPQRDLSRSPLFQVMFTLQNAPKQRHGLPGLSAKPMAADSATSKFDLTVFTWETDAGLQGSVEYSVDLFDPSTIERFARHLGVLLEGALANPDARLSQLPLLTADERQTLVSTWNDTSVPYPRRRPVHELFEEQAARAPAALAVVFHGRSLTYELLNTRANQLAHQLVRRGVGPETLVGLCLERGPEFVVATLAILKAGGAYVPLDPDYPADRLAFMQEDTKARVIVTQSSLRDRFPSHPNVLCVDTDWNAHVAPESTENPRSGAVGTNLAYVIYTSGSTGKPKGVAVTHEAIGRLVYDTRYVHLGPSDRVAQASNISFDAATFELWATLLHGARLVGVDKDTLLSPPRFAAQARADGINVMFVTTALFNQLAREVPQIFRGFRYVLFGGEAVDARRVAQVQAAGPPQNLLHVYGPTETTTFATWFLVETVPDGAATIPIGGPLANTTLYVLDPHKNLCPVGVPGELYIGGPGVARGYLNQPDMTASRFLPDPFSTEPGARLYRTGDLVRRRHDGNVEFVGRVDHQVKIRGFRIELGEIETTLLKHPAVREAVVTAREDGGDRRLVAYVVPKPETATGKSGEAAAPREHVQEWQKLFEHAYETPTGDAGAFNIAGWNSSYTRAPIPDTEMREWVDSTVARILSGRPRRCLEIGCGTGLLLLRVAPQAERYVGTDFSAASIEFLRGQLPKRDLDRVQLEMREATDFAGLAPRSFDSVVLNSIVQYFPSADYLGRVLEGAVDAVEDGGFIFVGDVRNLPLRETFHASVELAQAAPGVPLEDLRRRTEWRAAQEKELLLDPAYFAALRQRLPRIGHVEVLLKRGQAHNELTKYRYDVILHIGPTPPTASAPVWNPWQPQTMDLPSLRKLIETSRPAVLGISSVPNLRVWKDSAAWRAVAEGSQPNVGALREALAADPVSAVEPELLWQLGHELDYEVEISYSAQGPAFMDVALVRRDGSTGRVPVTFPMPRTRPGQGRLVNNPLSNKITQRIVPQLRSFLKERLPEYMVPSAIMTLEALPLSPNGKVDRRALPAPEGLRPELSSEFVPPRNPMEEVLAAMWAEVLRVDQVGVHDDFFALGGHSLLATQVLSRIESTFEVEVPLRDLFGAPTIDGLARLVDALRRERQDQRTPPIRPVARGGEMPLSFAQQRLWFLSQWEGQVPTYNVPTALRFSGPLHVRALEQALNEIVLRHEALRTTFGAHDGRPFQVVRSHEPMPLGVQDLSDLAPAERETEVVRQSGLDANQPFDLAQGPLLRFRLLRVNRLDHVLLLGFHHIAFDGWSLDVFFRELNELYRAYAGGRAPRLQPPPVQYADFAAWQRQWLQGEVLEKQLDFWRKQLAQLEPLELPTDRPRPAVQSFRGDDRYFELSAGASGRLRALSREWGVTLFMPLLAAFQALLHRYSGQADVAVGTPIAGRTRPETENLIGFFVNTLVLRTDVAGDPTFRQLVERVRAVCLEAYAHQDVPFEKLVEELQPQRDMSRPPLFQVMFALQNRSRERIDLEGVTMRQVRFEMKSSKFELTLGMTDGGDRLAGSFEYNADLFDGSTIERMAGHLQAFLEAATANPDTPLSRIQILTEPERHQILDEWNRTETDHPRGKPVHRLFEEQARRTPDAPAVVDEETTLTFHELDLESNRLAHRLRRFGAGPETLVAVCVERGTQTVVAFLATLKAGAAYLPIDASYPADRLAFMLQDARPAVLVTESHLLKGLPPHSARVLCLDDDESAIEASPEDPPEEDLPSRLAYVIYTSGSTGQPKGAMIEHGSLTSHWYAFKQRIPESDDGPRLNFALETSTSFDASIDIFLLLLAGHCLHIMSEEQRRDPHAFIEYARRKGIDSCNFVPSQLRQVLAAGLLAALRGRLRLVTVGGEAIDEATWKVLVEANDVAFYNLYGPTECTVDATICRVSAATTRPIIGKPVANVRVYVLDNHGNPVPVGVPGELYVAGEAVGRGYLNRPDLTAERFLPDPFQAPGNRMYRTGDRVRYLVDGNIQFLGRVDHQVKVRGYRIELGEIESVLSNHSSIREAVVVVREDTPGNPRLVAYCIGNDAGPATPVELREHLKKRLPEPMLPSAYVLLPDLPRTPAGKIDRKALPAPQDGRPDVGSAYVAPRDPGERAVAAIWCELLGLDSVGVHDNFFELGGHSLLATQVVSRLRSRLGAELPLRALFEFPTVEGLARAVANSKAGAAEVQAIPRVARERFRIRPSKDPAPGGGA